MQTFGTRLVEQRKKMGMSQGDLCILTGVNRNTQAAYEKDKRYPDAGYLAILLKHGFDVLYILAGDASPLCGIVNWELLRDALVTVDAVLAELACVVDPARKAKLASLVYQAAVSGGGISRSVAERLVDLAI